MYGLNEEVFSPLKSHVVTSISRDAAPPSLYQARVGMVSSVIRSQRATQVNVESMRAFVRLRRILASNTQLAPKLDALEKRYDAQFRVAFDAIRELMALPATSRRRIGFSSD